MGKEAPVKSVFKDPVAAVVPEGLRVQGSKVQSRVRIVTRPVKVNFHLDRGRNRVSTAS